jgi:hypothetical protein
LQAKLFMQPGTSALLQMPSLSVSPSTTVPVPSPGFAPGAQLHVLQPVASKQLAGTLIVFEAS